MKINLKNLSKLEKNYRMNDNQVSLNTLQTMLDVVLSGNNESSGGYELAINTLASLDIIDGVEIKKDAKQLNS